MTTTPIGVNAGYQPRRYSGWRTLPRLAAITPQYLESILWGALGGFSYQQWELFDLMLDTWPELSTCVQELTYGVERKRIIIEPYHEEDEKPTPSAVERSQFVQQALDSMMPNPATDEVDLRGTVGEIMEAWFRGQTVLEVSWQSTDLGITPRAVQWVHPNNYAFSRDFTLGLRSDTYNEVTSVQPMPANLIPFPPYRFLIGIHKAKNGPPTGTALLRPLAWWWCAANFSSDWLLNLAQIFGIPWRIAKYDPNAPPETLAAIDQMLQNMGSATWARFPTPTEIDLIQATKEGSDHSPQGELLDRADRYARSLILGQTMSGTHGTTGKGGGQAFGVVERNVKEDRVDAAGKFVASVINQQLIKSICQLNYGDTDECPEIRFLEEEEGGLPEAQRDQVLVNIGLPIGVDFMRKKYGVPEPAEGEELLSAPAKASPFGDKPPSGGQDENPKDTGSPVEETTDEAQPSENVQGRLMKLNAIKDDAIFAAELLKLADQLKGKQ